jgi:hypothetical protein
MYLNLHKCVTDLYFLNIKFNLIQNLLDCWKFIFTNMKTVGWFP